MNKKTAKSQIKTLYSRKIFCSLLGRREIIELERNEEPLRILILDELHISFVPLKDKSLVFSAELWSLL